MDSEAVNKTKEHYNSHANVHIDRQQALEARRQGAALPLKDFHNDIKRRMICRFAWQADRLLDLACGRGGDIHKWSRAQIGYVKGVDLSPGEIEEAKRRFEEYVKQRNPRQQGPPLQADFEDSDQLGQAAWRECAPFDAVTCMFAIHYFFFSERVLDTFLGNVVANLKDGGYFFGTFPSGKRVQDTIYRGRAWPHFEAPLLRLEALWKGQARPFDCAYTCAIGDTVTQGVGSTEGSYEYLVFTSTLLGVAAKHGLHPLTDWGDAGLDACFDEADLHKPIKHFRPRFPPNSDPSLAKASALFAAFAFQKRPAASQPLPPSNGKSAPTLSASLSQAPGHAAEAAAPAAQHDLKRRREEGGEAGPSPAAAAAAAGDAKTTHIGGRAATTLQDSSGRPPGAAAASLYKRPKPRGQRAPPREDAGKG